MHRRDMRSFRRFSNSLNKGYVSAIGIGRCGRNPRPQASAPSLRNACLIAEERPLVAFSKDGMISLHGSNARDAGSLTHRVITSHPPVSPYIVTL